jgi:hypothetical protein
MGIPTPQVRVRRRMGQQLTQADVQTLIAAALAPVQQDLADAQAEVNRL